jgi:hypothetical protein
MGQNAVTGLRWAARWAAVTATSGRGKSVLAGRTALRTNAVQQAGRPWARTSHASHRPVDTVSTCMSPGWGARPTPALPRITQGRGLAALGGVRTRPPLCGLDGALTRGPGR